MEAMRESWTDDRLDDLNGKVDSLRLEMRTEFKAVRSEMKEEFAAVRGETKEEFATLRGEIREGFNRMDQRFQGIDQRFQSMDQRLLDTYRMMMGFCVVMAASLLGLIATQI